MIGSTPREWRSDGSPVNGDVYAGFCGRPGGEIPPGYPTGGVTRRAIPRPNTPARLVRLTSQGCHSMIYGKLVFPPE